MSRSFFNCSRGTSKWVANSSRSTTPALCTYVTMLSIRATRCELLPAILHPSNRAQKLNYLLAQLTWLKDQSVFAQPRNRARELGHVRSGERNNVGPLPRVKQLLR